jgi:hypothetical protein
MIRLLKHEFRQTVFKNAFLLAQNKLNIHYKHQMINAVQVNNPCLSGST